MVTTNTKGFTLVEIMIVVGIIAVLAGIFLVGSGRFRDAANSARIKADLQKIEALQEVYYTSNNAYAGSYAILEASVGNLPESPTTDVDYQTNASETCAVETTAGALTEMGLDDGDGDATDYCIVR